MKKIISFFWKICVLCLFYGSVIPAGDVTIFATERRTEPKNPVHHCTMQDDGTDTTEWNYIYFGSYPQSEVTGNALTAEITGASYDENGDAWVNKTRYRRLHKRDTNADYFFGDNGYRYFKWEPIKWRVLQNTGSTLFLMADEGLDCKDYNEADGSVTWEECTLRNWLNNDFYRTAFDNEEQKAVVRQSIANEDNPEYETEGGNYTEDDVFLLSLSEIRNPDYGFCSGRSTYSVSRRVHTSDYANARGADSCNSSDERYSENCWWWLRTPGNKTSCASYIDYRGYLYWDGVGVFHDINACVPALYVDLASGLWTAADDGSGDSDPGQDPGNQDPENPNPDTDDRILPSNPRHHCTMQNDGSDKTDFSYVYFGSYPQSELAGNALTKAVTEASYDTNGDATVNGVKYRRISKSDTNTTANFGDSKYRYFKWEPIKWRVLQNDKDTLFVMADTGLDCKRYNDTNQYDDVIWETSSLRKWLKDDFYQTAFDSAQKEAISEDYRYYAAGKGDYARDKVSLLSVEEALNPEYGFCQNISTESVSRMILVSDYANARGADRSTEASYKGNGWWWIWTPPGTYDVAFAHNDGKVYQSKAFHNDYTVSVVPVLYIDISSDLWSNAENGGGGTGDRDPENEDTNEPTDLAEIRARAIAELNSYKTFTDYRKAQQKELTEIITSGKEAIKEAKDEKAVAYALFAAKTAMDRVKTDQQLTEEENLNSGNQTEKPGSGSQTDTEQNQGTQSDNEGISIPEVTAPKAVSIQGKVKAKKRGFFVKWNRQSSASGYQVQYSSSRKFIKKKTKIKTLIGVSKTKTTVKGLKSKKKYYVRVRVIQMKDGIPYYSDWSKMKTVKTGK